MFCITTDCLEYWQVVKLNNPIVMIYQIEMWMFYHATVPHSSPLFFYPFYLSLPPSLILNQ